MLLAVPPATAAECVKQDLLEWVTKQGGGRIDGMERKNSITSTKCRQMCLRIDLYFMGPCKYRYKEAINLLYYNLLGWEQLQLSLPPLLAFIDSSFGTKC